MKRRNFINRLGALGTLIPLFGAGSLSSCSPTEAPMEDPSNTKRNIPARTSPAEPRPITMWEFSWLERRWSGAGYEDWDLALSQLVQRGYNAIRIDAFPHLVANAPEKEHTLIPVWNTQIWGSPSINRVKEVGENLIAFISKCKDYDVKIGLSTWWRQDEAETYHRIKSPEDLAATWLKVLDLINSNNLLDSILYLDVSNEWPHRVWTPFKNDMKQWYVEESMHWMKKTVDILRAAYPDIPYTFSFYGEITEDLPERGDLSFLDFLEPHLWMVNSYSGEFYQKVGYWFEKRTNDHYEKLALHAEKLYRENENYWKDGLAKQIEVAANWSRKINRPLVTTECWGPIDYKDWPLLEWDWVMELCEFGVQESSKTGRWLSNASSNFCGPQFVGMWRETEWHQIVTNIIKNAKIDEELKSSKLAKRLA